jgi:cob(I)alamin adenosyltransferase
VVFSLFVIREEVRGMEEGKVEMEKVGCSGELNGSCRGALETSEEHVKLQEKLEKIQKDLWSFRGTLKALKELRMLQGKLKKIQKNLKALKELRMLQEELEKLWRSFN